MTNEAMSRRRSLQSLVRARIRNENRSPQPSQAHPRGPSQRAKQAAPQSSSLTIERAQSSAQAMPPQPWGIEKDAQRVQSLGKAACQSRLAPPSWGGLLLPREHHTRPAPLKEL